MLTHVVLRSEGFPAYESEDEEVNPGRYGKRLAEFIAEGLMSEGEIVGELIPEDWGWVVPVENPSFTLWVGVGNYEEYENGFLCFIEPHAEYVRKLWKKVPARERIELLQQRLNRVLCSSKEIHELKWSSHNEFSGKAS